MCRRLLTRNWRMPQLLYRYRAGLLALLLIGSSAAAGAAPYTPADDGAVLEQLPINASDTTGAALPDLVQAVRRQPGYAQAWLTRAAVEQAQGDYQAARKSCFALAPHTSTVVSYGCLMTVTSLNGAARQFSARRLCRFSARPGPRRRGGDAATRPGPRRRIAAAARARRG